MSMVHRYALAAQQAAEARLDAAFLVMAVEEGMDDDGEVDRAEYEAAAAQLAGPFCGCNTCVVREVLDAAAPDMARLFALNSSIN